MKKETIEAVAGLSWDNSRADTGINASKMAGIVPSWEEMKAKAEAGNHYVQYMIDEHVSQTEKTLRAYISIQSKVFEHGMENVIDRQAANS